MKKRLTFWVHKNDPEYPGICTGVFMVSYDVEVANDDVESYDKVWKEKREVLHRDMEAAGHFDYGVHYWTWYDPEDFE